MIDTILTERNPKLADFLERWSNKYNRSYNFSDTSEQAIFYEGIVELARHVASETPGASMSMTTNTAGVGSLQVVVNH
jgi:hypothetical protein